MLEGSYMKTAGSISTLHLILLIMTFIGLKNHVTIIPAILQDVGRDGWASVLLGAVVSLIWLFLIVYVHNKTKQQSIRDWLKRKIGKVGSQIVIYIFSFYLIALAAFTMRETILWINSTFLVRTPMLPLLIIYTILIVYLASSNIKTITIVNTFVLIGVLVLGFFVAFVNIQVKDYRLLRPFFEHGFEPIVYGAIYPASGFVELLLILFLQHKLKDRMRWPHFIIILFILMGLTLGPLIGAITEFGPVEAAKQRYPAYEEWGLATIGRFIEHLDFFSIYQWLTGAFIRIVVFLYIVSELLGISGDKKSISKIIVPPFLFSCLILTLVKDNYFIEVNKREFLKLTFFFFVAFSIFLAIVARIPGKSSKKSSHENDNKSGEIQSNQTKNP